MRDPDWYVIQVQTGEEDKTIALIENVCFDLLHPVPAGFYAPHEPKEQTGQAAPRLHRPPKHDAIGDDVPLLEECFSPRYETQHKFRGSWQFIERPLLPGYVIAITRRPHALALRLRSVPEFTRMLTVGEVFMPLQDEDRMWIEEYTQRGRRTVPMSVAVKKGDKIEITSGPLKGREGEIERINRSKSMAILGLTVGGKHITMRVGLAILNG